LGAAAFGCAVAQLRRRELQFAGALALGVIGIAVVVQRAGREYEPDVPAVVKAVAPAARGRVVVTNSAVVAYYARGLHARLDRPFGLGPGIDPRRKSLLVIDDTRVAGGLRSGPGITHSFGALYVRVGR